MNKHDFFKQFYPSYEQHEARVKELNAAWKEISSFAPQTHNTIHIGNYEIMLDDWSGKAPKGKSYEVDGKWYYDWEAAMSIEFPDDFGLPLTDEWIDICKLLDNESSELQDKLKLSLNGFHSGTSVHGAGSQGRYWSSPFLSTISAYDMYFTSSSVNPQYARYKYYGLAVRASRSIDLFDSFDNLMF